MDETSEIGPTLLDISLIVKKQKGSEDAQNCEKGYGKAESKAGYTRTVW